jgi:hypothetical protein
MKFLKKLIIAGALLLTATGTYVIGSVVAQAGNPPPPPSWVKPNGIVDLSKLPECIKRVGPNGELVRDNNGNPVCIPAKELFAPPPPPQSN